jgi:hemerythrin
LTAVSRRTALVFAGFFERRQSRIAPDSVALIATNGGIARMETTLERPVHAHAAHAGFVVEWRDGFRIGVDQVDAEHRHLFVLVKSLNLATVQDTLGELLDYVVTHFTHEQDLMESSGYPDFRHHLELHEQFSTQVADFLSSSSDWSEDRIQELRKFLNKWLVGHILTHDLRFGRWYLEHGRPTAPINRVVFNAPKPKVGWFDRLLGRG